MPRDGDSGRPGRVAANRDDDETGSQWRLRTDGGDTVDQGQPDAAAGSWRFPTLSLAWRNLSRNRLRTFLAALGICIGIFAVVVLGVFGTVLQLSASQELGSIGNQVIVSPADGTGEDALTSRQLQEIERAAAGRGTMVPLHSDGAVVSTGTDSTAAQVYGTDQPAVLFDGGEDPLPARHRSGVLVGSSVAESLDLQVGGSVTVGSQQYRIIAIMAPSEDITPIQANTAVVLPEDEFSGGFDQAVIAAETPAGAAAAAEDVRQSLNVRVEQVDIFELSEILETIDEFFTLLNRFLIALGTVSLIVAGVSILNLMLMSTAERRGEIGVMRAVGIHREDVLKLLLVEATLLGVLGGISGAVLSVLATAILWLATPIGLDVILVWRNVGYLVGGILFGVLVALVSGAYPAWRAANEAPVEALRG